MEQYTNQNWKQGQMPTAQQVSSANPKEESRFGDGLLDILSYLLVLPLFLLAIHFIPDVNWPCNLDRILLFVVLLFVVQLFIEEFRTLVLIVIIAGIVFLCYNSFINKNKNPYAYGWERAFLDYKELVYITIDKEIEPKNIVYDVLNSGYAIKVKEATEYDSPLVQEFANKCIVNDSEFWDCARDHQEYATLIQSFAIFKVIKRKWTYESEPKREDIPLKASETVKTMAGDCEDHAILMAAAIKSIGGNVRIVLAKEHAYPEICVGNESDFEKVKYIIKDELFPSARGKYLHCHNENGTVWLNLDYTENFPGGRFMNGDSKKLSVVKI